MLQKCLLKEPSSPKAFKSCQSKRSLPNPRAEMLWQYRSGDYWSFLCFICTNLFILAGLFLLGEDRLSSGYTAVCLQVEPNLPDFSHPSSDTEQFGVVYKLRASLLKTQRIISQDRALLEELGPERGGERGLKIFRTWENL